MIESLIGLLIYVLLFALAVWGAYWIIGKLPGNFQVPAQVIVGCIFLIIILLAVARYFGGDFPLPPKRVIP